MTAPAPDPIAVLKKLEWVIHGRDGDTDYCPCCNGAELHGHTPTCELAAAIAQGEADGWQPIELCPPELEEAILGGYYPNGQPWIDKTYRRHDRQWVGHAIDKPMFFRPWFNTKSLPAPPAALQSQPASANKRKNRP